MKMYDRVKLIKERAEYLKAGAKVNDEGIIIGENRNGYVLVVFEGAPLVSHKEQQANQMLVIGNEYTILYHIQYFLFRCPFYFCYFFFL